jgi:diguanylate cyclase
MSTREHAKHSTGRLFVAQAAISLVPVVLIGLLLAHSIAGQARARGLAEGASQAQLLAATIVSPQLTGHDLRDGLTTTERAALSQALGHAMQSGLVTRLRLRDLNGNVVFSPDGSGFADKPEDEALDAAHGETVTELTHLNSDSNDSGPIGPEVVEVYLPVEAGPAHTPVGVLEMYLPYAPIAQDVSTGSAMLYRDLFFGLALLYLVLAGLSYTTTRRLRRQAATNAYLADHDQLTGLPNRRVFASHIEQALGPDGNRFAAVAIVDLDRFKDVNDTLGHENGDDLLRKIAERLTTSLRPGDVVARLGGDEFGLVLNRVASADQADSVLERLRDIVAAPVDLTGLPLTTEASIGYVLAPDDGGDPQTLLQRADIAMYVAKTSRSSVVRYESAHDQFDPAQLAVVAELRDALTNNELVLHYQPQLDLTDGCVRSVEALIRWHHPKHGLLAPDAFLPVAEQTGLMDPLTDWVIAEALRQMAEWDGAGVHLSVSVNVSARNLTHATFTNRVLDALASSTVASQRLMLEITETALFTDLEKATDTLRRLRATGIPISLDDFGQGQTSLGFLARLPITELKIDRTFVGTMDTDISNNAIVRSVVEMAHNLGMRVVAEGAENEPVLNGLQAMGCDIVQGYVIARPMPAPELWPWLEAHQSVPTTR